MPFSRAQRLAAQRSLAPSRDDAFLDDDESDTPECSRRASKEALDTVEVHAGAKVVEELRSYSCD